jgi:hypothetical protein
MKGWYSLLILSLTGQLCLGSANDSLQISASVRHIHWKPDSLGQIRVSVTGGQPPYSISWSDINYRTNTRRDLYPGSYTATVTDQAGRTATRSFEVAYHNTPERTSGQYRVDSLYATVDSVSAMLSANVLQSGESGAWEIQCHSLRGELVAGVRKDSVLSGLPDHGFYINKGKLFLIQEKKIAGSYGKVKPNDRLRIRIESGVIRSYRNSELLKTAPLIAADYRNFVSVKGNGISNSEHVVSYNRPLVIIPKVIDKSCLRQTSGRIIPIVKGGDGPYDIQVFKGIDALPEKRISSDQMEPGKYMIKVTDHKNREKHVITEVATVLKWDAESVGDYSYDSSSVKRMNGDGWCGSRLYSETPVNTDDPGWIEIVADTAGKFFIGLSNRNSGANTRMYQGIYNDHGKLQLIELDQDGGFTKEDLGRLAAGKPLRMEIHAGQVVCKSANRLIGKSDLFTSGTCTLELSVFSSTTTINSIRTSYQCQ